MARNRQQIQRGVQWRWNLRNLPVRQAAAAQAASGKQPAVIAAPPQPPPPSPPPQPPQPVVRARGRARGARGVRGARGRARGRVRAAPVPVGRHPIAAAAGGHGEKNIDNAFIRNRGRYKIKRLLPVVKNVEVKRRGVTVRRMTARRRAIYPALRQQRQY